MASLVLASGLSAAEAADYTIRASHGESTDSALHKGWQVFEAYVESASGGQIEVNISPAGQLGSMTDALEQVKAGAIQLAHGDEQTMSTFYKPMLILATPYLFGNDEEGLAFLNSDFFMDVRDAMAEESGMRLLAGASYGFRSFTNNVKPIKSAADMAGIRMRVPPSPMSLEMVKAMGGSPTPVPWEELYGAMQSGVVDGQENPVGVVLDYSFYEVQDHLTLDNHQLGINTLMMNEDFFQSLPPELRAVVVTGAQMAAATEYGERNYQARVSAVDKLRELGMEVYAPTAEELATFSSAVKEPMQAYLKTELDPAYVDAVYAEIEKIRADRLAAVE
ncbi:TRAP transporter substrate-binding protein [Acuticoccus kandeliae]|uniref:TRAP transporter substrate-binding protein n=1 Tax=Acuticoccus kandeliae TaxID=2073160 RepID=UPI00196A7492|nr:TRAP transporter substrate-binding protein [Acuticoccus kandeliae]